MNKGILIGLMIGLVLVASIVFVSAYQDNTEKVTNTEITPKTCGQQNCNNENCGSCGGQCGNPNCGCSK